MAVTMFFDVSKLANACLRHMTRTGHRSLVPLSKAHSVVLFCACGDEFIAGEPIADMMNWEVFIQDLYENADSVGLKQAVPLVVEVSRQGHRLQVLWRGRSVRFLRSVVLSQTDSEGEVHLEWDEEAAGKAPEDTHEEYVRVREAIEKYLADKTKKTTVWSKLTGDL